MASTLSATRVIDVDGAFPELLARATPGEQRSCIRSILREVRFGEECRVDRWWWWMDLGMRMMDSGLGKTHAYTCVRAAYKLMGIRGRVRLVRAMSPPSWRGVVLPLIQLAEDKGYEVDLTQLQRALSGSDSGEDISGN